MAPSTTSKKSSAAPSKSKSAATGTGEPKKLTLYQAFVKDTMPAVRAAGFTGRDVMKQVARRWKRSDRNPKKIDSDDDSGPENKDEDKGDKTASGSKTFKSKKAAASKTKKKDVSEEETPAAEEEEDEEM